MEQNGVKANMKPEYKLILSTLRYYTLAEKTIPLEEYLFFNKEILGSLDLFILEPKKFLEQFKDKILFAYVVKYLSEKQIEQIEQINCVAGACDPADMHKNTINFKNYLKIDYFSPHKADEVIDYLSSKEDLFLKIKVTE